MKSFDCLATIFLINFDMTFLFIYLFFFFGVGSHILVGENARDFLVCLRTCVRSF